MRTLIFAALLLAGCAQSQTLGSAPRAENAQVDRSQLPQHIRDDLDQRDTALSAQGVVAAELGETADLGGGLKVRPLEVLEDSRCPQDARCVWAGRLRLRVAVDGVGELEVSDDQGVVQTEKGSFQLAAISPGTWADWPQEQLTPYRFGFKRA